MVLFFNLSKGFVTLKFYFIGSDALSMLNNLFIGILLWPLIPFA